MKVRGWTTLVWCVALSVAVVALNGCGGASGPQTPQEVLTNMANAMADGDRDAYLACFKGTEEEIGVMMTIFDASCAAQSFGEKLTAAYGKESLGGATASWGAGPLRPPDPQKLLAQAEFDVQGTTAVVRQKGAQDADAGPNNAIHMIREGGRWYIKAASMVPTGQAAKMRSIMEKFPGIYEELEKEIGKEGVSAQDIQQMFAVKFMSVVMEGAQQQQPE